MHYRFGFEGISIETFNASFMMNFSRPPVAQQKKMYLLFSFT